MRQTVKKRRCRAGGAFSGGFRQNCRNPAASLFLHHTPENRGMQGLNHRDTNKAGPASVPASAKRSQKKSPGGLFDKLTGRAKMARPARVKNTFLTRAGIFQTFEKSLKYGLIEREREP